MKRHQLLGHPEIANKSLSELAASYPAPLEDFFGLGNYPADWNHTGMRWSDVSKCLEIVTLAHLGYSLRDTNSGAFAIAGARIAVDYFYGDYLSLDDWSEEMRRSQDNDFLLWSGVFRDGLFLATLVHAQEDSRKLCQWVAPWLPYDESEYDFSRQGVAYLKLLAAVVDERTDEMESLSTEIDKTRTKRWKLLRDALLAIQNQDATSFGENISTFLQHYLKAELGRQFVSDWVSLDASTLWNLAIDRRMAMPDLDDRAAALIVTQDTITDAA